MALSGDLAGIEQRLATGQVSPAQARRMRVALTRARARARLGFSIQSEELGLKKEASLRAGRALDIEEQRISDAASAARVSGAVGLGTSAANIHFLDKFTGGPGLVERGRSALGLGAPATTGFTPAMAGRTTAEITAGLGGQPVGTLGASGSPSFATSLPASVAGGAGLGVATGAQQFQAATALSGSPHFALSVPSATAGAGGAAAGGAGGGLGAGLGTAASFAAPLAVGAGLKRGFGIESDVGGALSGAAAGALAGSVIPGVGTLVGAGLGAIGGATVICTELHRQGYLDDNVFKLDGLYRYKHIDNDDYDNYLEWGTPVAEWMKESPMLTKIIKPFGIAWAKSMAHKMDSRYPRNKLGEWVEKIGIPISNFIGKTIKSFRREVTA